MSDTLVARPSGRSASTASPTTSTPTRRARTGRGRSTRCRSCCRPRSGAASRPASSSAPTCSTASSATLRRAGAAEERRDPAAVVFGHRGFLRRPQGLPPAAGCTSCSTPPTSRARPTAAGGWSATARRRPRASGYALENRLVVSRVFPQMFRELPVQHLASLLRRAALRRCCAGRRAATAPTRIVLLTPGPYNETYFEHALLARYLGFALVEGNDLTVRDDRVWLKTIDGLQRVHAIVRRQDDDYCDPLELRSDSALGVAGLDRLRAARQRAARQRARLGRARVGRAARLPADAQPRACSASRCCCRRSRPGGSASRPRSRTPGGAPSGSSSSRSSARRASGRSSSSTFPPTEREALRRAHRASGRSTTSPRSGCTCRRRRCSRATPAPRSRRAPSACACSRWRRRAAGASCPAA